MSAPRVVLFGLPKPMKGHDAVTQRNSIESWVRLKPKPEVVLVGSDEGVSELAQELDASHVPEVGVNELGTPLVNEIFKAAEEHIDGDVYAYINADIILMDNFIGSINALLQQQKRFLMVGRRWNIDQTELIDFSDKDWQTKLRDKVVQEGFIYPTGGVDYFVYTKGLFSEIPPFAVGRTVWDNWLVWDPLSRNEAVVDSTRTVLAVHHNHGYEHVVGPKDDPMRAWGGEEAQANRALGGPDYPKGDLKNVTLELRNDTLVSRSVSVDVNEERAHRRREVIHLSNLAAKLLVDGNPSGCLETAIQAESFEIDFPGLRHIHGLALIQLNRVEEAAEQLMLSSRSYPGRADTQELLSKLIQDQTLVSQILNVRCPDLHRSELDALQAVFSFFSEPVQVINFASNDRMEHFKGTLPPGSEWMAGNDAALQHQRSKTIALLPIAFEEKMIHELWPKLSTESLIVVSSARRRVSDSVVPADCLVTEFEDPKIAYPENWAGGISLVTPSDRLCTEITKLLTESFPDAIVRRRVSKSSFLKKTLAELEEDRKMLMDYSIAPA